MWLVGYAGDDLDQGPKPVIPAVALAISDIGPSLLVLEEPFARPLPALFSWKSCHVGGDARVLDTWL